MTQDSPVDLSFMKWLGHASFLMNIRGKQVYIDPFEIQIDLPKADIIFITHEHFDHFNEEAILKIATDATKFVAPKDIANKLRSRKVLSVEPGKSYEIDGINFSTVPAYTNSKEFHPRSKGWVGYIIDADGTTVYHPGDTDAIKEMNGITVDVALLPIGGRFTMDVEEAVKAAKMIHAKVFVPMHYRAVLGKEESSKAEEEFKKKINCVIMKQIQEPNYSFQH
jgi:L-ascorbate metabolism protein UlaG (beta-lactamase superfamily)